MYCCNSNKANQISSAVFLIGLGMLFATGYLWPGIFFVIGASMLAQGLASGRGWYSLQGAIWMIGLGIWFALGSPIGALLVIVGVSVLVGALVRPPIFAKPHVDNS